MRHLSLPVKYGLMVLGGWCGFAVGHCIVIVAHGLYAADVVVSQSMWIVADAIPVGLGAIVAGLASVKLVALYFKGIKALIVDAIMLGCQALGGYFLYIVLTFLASCELVPLLGGRGGC